MSGKYTVLRCAACAADFVAPMPDAAALRAYYDRAAWFEGGEPGGYQNYDTQTEPLLPFFDALLDEFGAEGGGRSVLDIGCGYGSHLAQAHRRGWKCFGVEVSAHARQVIRERHGHQLFVVDDVHHLIPHEFDLIVLFDVLEHLADPYRLFYTLFSQGAITPKTKVVITTPNARSASALADPAGWAYRHPPSHLVYYSAEALTTLLRRLHFSSVEVQGMHAEQGLTAASYPDEPFALNQQLTGFGGLYCKASGSDFAAFIQERYVPGTWSKLAEYEHLPRYLFARELAAGRRVLDFGCGTGYGTALLAQRAQSVTGIDIDGAALQWARAHHRAPNLGFEQRSDLGAALPAAAFDLITCFEMIEHVSEPVQVEAIHSFARLLKPDGMALISTPNPEITKLYGANPFHIREMSRREFEDLLRESFEFVQIFEQYIQTSVLITQQPLGRNNRSRALDWEPSSSSMEAAVFVAVCSHWPLPPLDGAYFFDFRSDFVAEQLQAMADLNRSRFDYFQAAEEVAAANASKRMLREEMDRRQLLLESKDRAAHKQAEEIHRLLGEVGAKDLALHGQAEEIHRLHEVVALSERTMGEYAAEVARLMTREQEQRDEIHRLMASAATLNQALTDKQRELSALRLSNWHRLGEALRQPGLSLNRLGKIAYYSAACLTPQRWKPFVQPWAERLKQRYRKSANPASALAPQAIHAQVPASPERSRVLHVIANFMLGGSSRLVMDLVGGLGDAYEHKVATSYLPSPPVYAGVDVTEFRSPQSPDDVLPFLREYQPDIVHVHYWGDCDWWWYDIFFRAIATLDCRVIENVNTPIEPYQARFVDRYVHVSRYVEQEFGDGSGANLTIYPGSDFSHFCRPQGKHLASECIGMVYRLEADKLNLQAIDVFIKVVQRRPQTRALIVGGGSFLEPYRQAVMAAGVEDNFEFTGYVDYTELPAVYERMGVFVAPVWKESFGQVSPFAMNMGIPVVGYAVGGVAEIVDDPSLLAPAGDSDALADLIVRLLDDPARCREIGTRNHERAQALFSVEAMTGAYRRLYDELLGVGQ